MSKIERPFTVKPKAGFLKLPINMHFCGSLPNTLHYQNNQSKYNVVQMAFLSLDL